MANQYNTRQIKALSPEDFKNVKKKSQSESFIITFFNKSDNNSFLLESVLNKIAGRYKHRIPFYRCTVSTPEVAQTFYSSVKKLPSTVLVRKGKAWETFYGVLPQHKIEGKINLLVDQ